jgi:hypothetical protein
MKSVLALLIFVSLVAAQLAPPELPQQFKAKVVANLPFVGQVPGVLYYDYPNLRQRIDITQWGQYFIDLYRYDIETEFQIASSQCQSQALTDPMYPMTVPPFAVYNGTQELDSQQCELWTADMFGVAVLNYYVTNSTDNTGKVTYTLVRFQADLPAGFSVTYDFNSVTPGPQDSSFFDYTSFGCQGPQPRKYDIFFSNKKPLSIQFLAT